MKGALNLNCVQTFFDIEVMELWLFIMKSTKKIKIILFDRRTFTFLVCLSLSIFLWTLIRLSKTLQSEFSVDILITNVPDDLFLNPLQTHKIKVRAEGKVYTLLKYYSEKKTLTIDFNDLEYVGDKKYRLSKNISNKLNVAHQSNLKIQNTYSDTIYIDLEKKYSKKVPIWVNLNASFEKEYQLTELTVKPDSVMAMGFKDAIDTLRFIPIRLPEKRNVKESFNWSYRLKKSEWMVFDTEKIAINAFVDKISEYTLTIPVQVLNAPQDSQLKIFPAEVTVLCSGDLDTLKNIHPDDINVVADFLNSDGNSSLPLRIETKLKRVKVSFLNEDKVDFLKKKI